MLKRDTVEAKMRPPVKGPIAQNRGAQQLTLDEGLYLPK